MNLKNTVVSTGLLCLLQIGYADANDQRMPTVDELAKLLIERVEKLDNLKVEYRYEYEYLFPVAGLTSESVPPKSTGRCRTVLSGRRRRFERFPDNLTEEKYPYTLTIFDGKTTAEGHLMEYPDGVKAASVFLHGKRTHLVDQDCQVCSCLLQKPLSDAALSLAYDNAIFPYSLRLVARDRGDQLVQVDPQFHRLEGTECLVVRFPLNGDSYWLDPKRDFAVVRREMFATVDDKKYLDIRSTARDFRRHGDYWVPYSYVREHGVPVHLKERAGEVFYRVSLTIEKLSLDEVTDDDFKVPVAAGAPIHDADSGQLLVNPAKRLAEVASLVADVEAKRLRWRWLITGIVVVLVFIGWCWKVRRRGMATINHN
jgi:hypothetical protein